MLKNIRALVGGASLLGLALGAQAAALSFSGTFTSDANTAIASFQTTASGLVTIETFSYAGGTDPTGKVVAEGGFDTVFGLYNSAGTLLAVGDDGATRTDTVDVGAAFDALWSGTLAAGSYFIVLGEYDNYPVGPSYSNGFLETGNGNFTSAYGCTNGKFCDVNGFNRTGNYDLAVSGTSVTVAAIPEPSTVAMMSLALVGLIARTKSRRNSSNSGHRA